MINIFRAYMLRRTHEETLFGLPILKLPDIYENTIVVKFSASERFLYKAMVAHSVDNFICELGFQFLPLTNISSNCLYSRPGS